MVGKTISHFMILDMLGDGGMGVIYAAQHPTMEISVKVMMAAVIDLLKPLNPHGSLISTGLPCSEMGRNPLDFRVVGVHGQTQDRAVRARSEENGVEFPVP